MLLLITCSEEFGGAPLPLLTGAISSRVIGLDECIGDYALIKTISPGMVLFLR
jgi:hypothetical protein